MSDSRGLSYRKSLLDKTIREVPNKLDVVRGIVCTGMKEVLDVFEARMAAQDEGIIIKDLASKYMPANRSTNHWIKLKADYIDALGDTLDLIIMGGYYGQASRSISSTSWAQHLTSFLVGVIVKVDPKVASRSTAMALCKVGQGLSMEQLSGVRNVLKDNLEPYNSKF